MPYQGDNLMAIKRTNRSAALRILHERGSMSRKRLAENLKLTPAAITKIVGELLEEGLLREGEPILSSAAGRREVLLELNPEHLCALGVFINLREAVLSAAWLDGRVIFREAVALPERAKADPSVARLAERLMALAEAHGLERERILGVGLAVRGTPAADQRSVVNSFGALDEEDYPICSRFEALTGLRTILANNVRALFAAQMFLARDEEVGAQFFLRCEYGIGAALAIDGRIWNGVTQQCAEIGHIPVIRRGGKPCTCGKSGCLETIASPTAIREDALAALSPTATPILWKLAGERRPEQITVEDVLRAAQGGDSGAAAIVDRAVIALGAAIKSVIYLVDPGKIVLYGRLFEDPYYLSRLLSELREGIEADRALVIEKSRYNQRLEDKAAPLLAVREFFDNGGIAP